MVPALIVVDPNLVDFYTHPTKGAVIYEDHVRVHPDEKLIVTDGLIKMFGDVFDIISVEEYNAIKSEKK